MSTFFDAGTRAELEARLERLTPDHRRRWGRMSPHQAVCHLTDSFTAVLGDRPLTTPRVPWYVRTAFVRFAALTLPLPWPKGVTTAPEMDQEDGGTPPEDFERDRERLQTAMERFAARGGEGLEPHVVFGELTAGEWGRWGYRHTDHHLRQFGV